MESLRTTLTHTEPSVPSDGCPKSLCAGTTGIVDEVIRSRASIRGYLRKPVSMKAVRDILEVAARAPSGTNIQPWKVYVLREPVIRDVSMAISSSGIRPERAPWTDYRYYPRRIVEPYLSRRRELGAALYGLLGIRRRDTALMRQQFDRNFSFFGAPVGLIVAIDRDLEVGSWIDLGMFLQNILIAAQARGLSTCVQAAFAPYHEQVRPVIGMPDCEVLVCGIALGYADRTRPENSLRTNRAPLSDWVRFPSQSKPCQEPAADGEKG